MSDVEYDFGVPEPTAIGRSKRGKSIHGITSIIRKIPKGGSVFIAGKTSVQTNSVYQSLKLRESVDFKICSRNTIENCVQGVRVWRIDAE